MDGRVAAGGAPEDVGGVGDVAGHHLDPQVGQGIGVGFGPGQGPDVVAPLDQELADIGAGQSGGAGDEDRLTHAEACSGVAANSASTCEGSKWITGSLVPNTSRVWMKRCTPMVLAQAKPSSTICAAVKTSLSSR